MSSQIRVLPVVQQDVGCPHLVCGEAQVLHPRMFALVPLQVMVVPVLKQRMKFVSKAVEEEILYCVTVKRPLRQVNVSYCCYWDQSFIYGCHL